MTWQAIIAAILEFFGPLLRAWLEELLQKAEAKLGGPPLVPVGAESLVVGNLFAAARAETWWFQLRRRAALAVCERIAKRRAGEILIAAAGGVKPVLAGTEAREIAESLM